MAENWSRRSWLKVAAAVPMVRLDGFGGRESKSAAEPDDAARREPVPDAFPTQPPELVRDMYGLAAARWVQESRRAHYVLVPASDEDLLRAWYRLGFGQQQAHAVRPLPDRTPVAPPKVMVRRARRSDLPALAGLEVELP